MDDMPVWYIDYQRTILSMIYFNHLSDASLRLIMQYWKSSLANNGRFPVVRFSTRLSDGRRRCEFHPTACAPPSLREVCGDRNKTRQLA